VRRADRHRYLSPDRPLGVVLIANISCRHSPQRPADARTHDAGVTATIAAVGDSRPGARDMFIDVVLGPID